MQTKQRKKSLCGERRQLYKRECPTCLVGDRQFQHHTCSKWTPKDRDPLFVFFPKKNFIQRKFLPNLSSQSQVWSMSPRRLSLLVLTEMTLTKLTGLFRWCTRSWKNSTFKMMAVFLLVGKTFVRLLGHQDGFTVLLGERESPRRCVGNEVSNYTGLHAAHSIPGNLPEPFPWWKEEQKPSIPMTN